MHVLDIIVLLIITIITIIESKHQKITSTHQRDKEKEQE